VFVSTGKLGHKGIQRHTLLSSSFSKVSFSKLTVVEVNSKCKLPLKRLLLSSTAHKRERESFPVRSLKNYNIFHLWICIYGYPPEIDFIYMFFFGFSLVSGSIWLWGPTLCADNRTKFGGPTSQCEKFLISMGLGRLLRVPFQIHLLLSFFSRFWLCFQIIISAVLCVCVFVFFFERCFSINNNKQTRTSETLFLAPHFSVECGGWKNHVIQAKKKKNKYV
jgi:hypothetical protein